MWVRPILTMLPHSLALASMASCSTLTEGNRRSATFIAAAMYIADGYLSFDDWDMLTWSLGWTGVLEPSGVPPAWQQLVDNPSLTVVVNDVPLPAIRTVRANMA